MDNDNSDEEDGQSNQASEWNTVTLWFPQMGLLLTRMGVNRRLLMPGKYLRRRSRTYNSNIYREMRPG